MDSCLLKGVEEPVIISESGRALASHASVLVFDVLNASHHPNRPASSFTDKLIKDALASHSDALLRDGQATTLQMKDAGEYLLSTFYEVLIRPNVGIDLCIIIAPATGYT